MEDSDFEDMPDVQTPDMADEAGARKEDQRGEVPVPVAVLPKIVSSWFEEHEMREREAAAAAAQSAKATPDARPETA